MDTAARNVFLAKLGAVYGDRNTPESVAISDAVAAVLDGSCPSPMVLLGLETLDHIYQLKAVASDVAIGERYVAECWSEWQGRAGAQG